MSSSGRSSLLVALGHRAVARKCEQLASRPSAFKATAQHACTRKSCLKREGSPEPSIILSSVDSTGKQTLEGGPSSCSPAAVAARRMSSSDTSGYEGSENGDSAGSEEEAERERARRASEAQEQEPLPPSEGCKGQGEEDQGGQGRGCSHLWAKGRRRAEGEDSGEETEGAMAYDAEAEGRDLLHAGTQSVHGYHGDEEDALADRLFAQHLIMERPELQRFDSADAAMHAWHRKQEEEEQAKQTPLAFQPSQPRTGCEMADTPPPMCYDRHGQEMGDSCDGATPPMHSPMPRRNIRHHEQEEEDDDGHGSCGCQHEEGDDYVLGLRSYPSANSLDFFMPAPPTLQHFDSADYHMAKAKADDAGEEERLTPGDSADKARGAAPPTDGYRSVASWFIKRGETRSKRFG